MLSGGELTRQVAATGAKFGTGVARQPRQRLIAIGVAIVAVIAGGGVYALTSGGGGTPANAPISPGVTLPGPFRVMSMTPAPGDRRANGSDPVQVTFSAPVAAGSPQPTLTPNVAGSWQSAGDTLTFTPSVPFSPSTQVTVTVPSGVRSSRGSLLAKTDTASFSTEAFSNLALADLLSQLGYLPGSYQPPDLGTAVTSRYDSVAPGRAGEMELAYDPPAGTMNWDQGYPASLASQWQQGSYNVVLRGAVMAFQAQHNMTTNGDVTPALWNALFKAKTSGQDNVSGYTYAVASKGSPETLTIYHDGKVVLQTLANTGGSGTPTVDGTFPVYEKFLNTIMSGTNPDGSHYSDPVQYVSYFNGGDAVHYFPRGAFGFPQSLGCVELPFDAAKAAYPWLTLGSLVTVTG